MLQKSVTLGFLMSLTALPASADEQLNPELDIIAGSMDAPHELVIYFSPGCAHCLDALAGTTAHINNLYVEPGHLRIIYRDVPQVFPYREGEDEYNERARRISHDLGYSLRCHHHVGGSDGYLSALNNFVEALVEIVPTYSSQMADWPAVSSEFQWSLQLGRSERSPYSEQDLAPCAAGEHLEDAGRAFERNGELLQEALGGQWSVPAYFLDGEQIKTMGENWRIIWPIEQAIPEAGE